jgi:RecA-family ATPase
LEMTAGQPGLGKSQIQISWAATVTTGGTWPDDTRVEAPGAVIMVTAEDCLAQVIVPRLVAAGADLKRIHFLKLIRQDDKDRMFLLSEDLDTLEQAIVETQAALVCIDPITAFMGSINSHQTTDVRNQLGPLADLAERTNVAISTITHPPKAAGARAQDHFIGSQAFIAAARIGHLVVPEMTEDTDGNPEPSGCVLVTNAKNNLSLPMPSLVYVQDQTVVGEGATQITAPFVHWCGTADVTADEAVAATTKPKSKTRAADKFLKNFLADGDRWEKEVMEAAEAQAFTKNQIRDARERLNITQANGCVWKAGLDGWKWRLPEDGRGRA